MTHHITRSQASKEVRRQQRQAYWKCCLLAAAVFAVAIFAASVLQAAWLDVNHTLIEGNLE